MKSRMSLCLMMFLMLKASGDTIINDDFKDFTPHQGTGLRTIQNDQGTLNVFFVLPWSVFKKHDITLQNSNYTRSSFESHYDLIITNQASTIQTFNINHNANFILNNTQGSINNLNINQESKVALNNQDNIASIALYSDSIVSLSTTKPIPTLTQTNGLLDIHQGAVHNYTLSQGRLRLQNGSITTLTSDGAYHSSIETNPASSITTLTHQGTGTLALKNKGTIASATQEGSGILVLEEGSFNTITIKSGSLQNQGQIKELKSEGGKIDNQNLIDKVELKSGHTSFYNAGGRVNELNLKAGNLTFRNKNQEGAVGVVDSKFEVSGNGILVLDTNRGIVEKDGLANITVGQNSSPTVVIENLHVQTKAGAPSPAVKFTNNSGANTQAKVQIGRVVISTVDFMTKIGQSIPLNGVVIGASNITGQNAYSYIKDADFSEILKKAGFYGRYNPITGILETNFQCQFKFLGNFFATFHRKT